MATTDQAAAVLGGESQDPLQSSLIGGQSQEPQQETPALARQYPQMEQPKQSKVAGVYHGILAALGGSYENSYSVDPNTGQTIQSQVRKSPGSQWKQIMAGALIGLGAGGQTNRPGAQGLAGAGAGFAASAQHFEGQDQQKRQQATQEFQQQQTSQLNKATMALQSANTARSAWLTTAEQSEASVQAVEAFNTFNKALSSSSESRDLGVFPNSNALMKYKDSNPELMKQLAGGEIIAMPEIQDGKYVGVRGAFIPFSMQDRPVSSFFAGEEVPPLAILVPGKMGKDGKLDEPTWRMVEVDKNMRMGDYLSAQGKMQEQEAGIVLRRQREADIERTLAAAAADRRKAAESGPTSAVVNSWVSKINKGETTISQVPYTMRNAVIEAQEKTGEIILTNVQRADVKKLTSMQKLIDDMKKLKERVHPAGTGAESKLSGAYRTAKRWITSDPLVTEVESLLAQTATIARAISGEVGVLTNPDIARADTLRPTMFNSAADWDAKLSSFQNGIDRGYDTLSDTAGVSSSQILGRNKEDKKGVPLGPPEAGMKWQQNTKTGEFRQVPVTQ